MLIHFAQGPAIKQYTLPLSVDRQCRFDNFIGNQHAPVIDSLKALVDGSGERQILIFGGEGKTHLINATACHAREAGLNSQLYDGQQLKTFEASAFDGWQQADLLAVDNLDAIAGNRGWEAQFYQVMNAVRETSLRFVFSMSVQPKAVHSMLPDFHSRLHWGLQFSLQAADDEMLAEILRHKAHAMGMSLKDDVLNYLLTHVSRRLADQLLVLHHLEQVTLAEKRRPSIPLVKQVLEQSDRLDHQAWYDG